MNSLHIMKKNLQNNYKEAKISLLKLPFKIIIISINSSSKGFLSFKIKNNIFSPDLTKYLSFS